jgi:putative flippase GtrA
MSNLYSRALTAINLHFATLLRFSSVGLLATFVYLVVSNGLIVASLARPAWASLFGYLGGMIFSFLGQSQFTFRTSRVTSAQIVRFGILSVVGILISYGGIHVLVNYSMIQTVPATIIVAALIALCSFVIMNVWVFGPRVERN